MGKPRRDYDSGNSANSINEKAFGTMDAKQTLDHEFLDIRSRILDVASSMDRIQRADGDAFDDDRMSKLREALQITLSNDPHRAEKVQLLFSREYDEHWKDQFSMPASS